MTGNATRDGPQVVFVWFDDNHPDLEAVGSVEEFREVIGDGEKVTVWECQGQFEAHPPDNIYWARVVGYAGVTRQTIEEHISSINESNESSVHWAVEKFLEDVVEAFNQR